MLMLAMPKSTPTPDGEGRFYDVREIFNAIKLADRYSELTTHECQCAMDQSE